MENEIKDRKIQTETITNQISALKQQIQESRENNEKLEVKIEKEFFESKEKFKQSCSEISILKENFNEIKGIYKVSLFKIIPKNSYLIKYFRPLKRLLRNSTMKFATK